MADKSYHEVTEEEWKIIEKNITGGEKDRASANKSSRRI